MKNVLSKLANARAHIKTNRIKPDGKNSFSNYDYFTPEMVTKLVNDACKVTNTISLFSLKQDQYGYYGEVIFTDLESGESVVTTMRTEKPSIKATNETQQCGGMQTYTKRYALMSLFDIEDNAMDFDSQNNSKPAQQQQAQPATASNSEDKPWLNKWADKERTKETELWGKVLKALVDGKRTITDIEARYKINKELKEELKSFEKRA